MTNHASFKRARTGKEQREGAYLFTYGTLRTGGGAPLREALMEGAERVGEARLQGRLYMVGEYPGAVLSEEASDVVRGELLASQSGSHFGPLGCL